MADITLSKSVRANLLNLQNTASLMSKTQERLSTGLKVNSALDNPSNFFTSASLNSRAGDLGRLLDSVGLATDTIDAANNGITAITKLVENAQATARQALQSSRQVIKNEVIGDSAAVYNPKALSIVTGDNSVTGTNAGPLAADAATTSTLTIGADRANAAVTLGGATAFATDATLLNASGTLQVGDTFTIEIDNGSATPDTLTITFAAANAAVTTVGGTATAATLSVELDATLGGLRTAINTALDQLGGGTSNVVAAGAPGSLTLAAEDGSVESIRVLGRDGTTAFDASVLTDLGFASTGTAVGGQAADRLITRNAAFDALAGAGDTLSISTGFGGTWSALGTITFGAGATAVKTRAQLASAMAALSPSIIATVNGGGTGIDVTMANSFDYGTAIRFGQASGDGTLAAFNLTGSDAGAVGDVGNVDQSTYNPTNLLTQGAVTAGDTIEIKIGTHVTTTLTFGMGLNQIRSIAELNAALGNLSGGAASVDARGEINITSDAAQDTIAINGIQSVLDSFGLIAGETNNLISSTSGIADGDKLNIQIGANTPLTITFGSGVGQVNTFKELQAALDNLAGGTATIDGITGAMTVKTTNGADNMTITTTDSTNTPKNAVADAFGLTNSTTPIAAVTVDNTVRTELEKNFNVLVSQINDLAKDASLNGVNLLYGNDLSVIFNEDASSRLEINGVIFDAAGLGLSTIAAGYFQTDANVESSLDSLQHATDLLRAQASTFGSNLSVVQTRQDFTKKMINTLETGASNLTLADTNEEAANLLALQTRQQLSSTALSLASQADQNVLRLFQ